MYTYMCVYRYRYMYVITVCVYMYVSVYDVCTYIHTFRCIFDPKNKGQKMCHHGPGQFCTYIFKMI